MPQPGTPQCQGLRCTLLGCTNMHGRFPETSRKSFVGVVRVYDDTNFRRHPSNTAPPWTAVLEYLYGFCLRKVLVHLPNARTIVAVAIKTKTSSSRPQAGCACRRVCVRAHMPRSLALLWCVPYVTCTLGMQGPWRDQLFGQRLA